jgi:hypothetical protein
MTAKIYHIADFRKKGGLPAAPAIARPAFTLAAAGTPRAVTRPYRNGMKFDDSRVCAALKIGDSYLVLEFSEDVTERDMARAEPGMIYQLNGKDFEKSYAPRKTVPLNGELYDLFNRYIFTRRTGASVNAVLCSARISAVHEVVADGAWQPGDTQYTVDEDGWRPVNPAIMAHRGELIVEYEGGNYICAATRKMRWRLAPATGPRPPSPV